MDAPRKKKNCWAFPKGILNPALLFGMPSKSRKKSAASAMRFWADQLIAKCWLGPSKAGLRYLQLPVRGCKSGAELLRTMADDLPAGQVPIIEGRELIRQLRRRQHHKGREIRHASPMGTPRASQLNNLNPAWWKWKTALSTTWQYPEHKNILEMRMFSVGVRWRLSSPSAFNSTGLHEPRTVRFPSYQ